MEKFIEGFDDETSARVDRTIEVLEKVGHLIEMPDSKSLGKGLFELRVQGKRQVRIIYLFKDNKAYVIHGFIKKANKISPNDMEYARRIQKETTRLA